MWNEITSFFLKEGNGEEHADIASEPMLSGSTATTA
jgi:hypothetical protein